MFTGPFEIRARPARAASRLAAAVAVAAALAASGGAALAYGQEDGVEAARSGLRRGGFPWYDKVEDGLSRAEPQLSDDDFSGRHSQRVKKPPKPKAKQPAGANRATGAAMAMEGIAWAVLIVLIVAIVALLATAAIRRQILRDNQLVAASTAGSRKADRVEHLPAPITATAGSLLDQARAHYEQGRLGEAIVCLFSHELIQLDNRRLIELERGKTNRQYLREIRQHPALCGILEQSMNAFEEVFFGHRTLSAAQFEACWRQVDGFQQQVERAERP